MADIFASYKWLALYYDRSIFLEGLSTTLEVALFAIVLALVLGVLFGVAGV